MATTKKSARKSESKQKVTAPRLKSDVQPSVESDVNAEASFDDGNPSTDTSGRDVTGVKKGGRLDRGEQLAKEAVKKGVTDNGKTYKNPKITPKDTNAPDAGLTPDGRRVAD